MDVTSKTAIVTGASRGLGASISSALVQKECRVFGIARSADSLNDLQQQLGERFIPVVLDITSQDDITQWVKETFSATHSPDILINNAGSGYFEELDKLPPERWHQMMATNLDGVFYLTREIVPLMKRQKSTAHIINIGSILGKTANAKQSAYSATKFAIRGFSEALFKELRYEGIKVTCLNPGSIETGFFSDSGIKSHGNMLNPDTIARTLIHILETPNNMLINELTLRPLNPKLSK